MEYANTLTDEKFSELLTSFATKESLETYLLGLNSVSETDKLLVEFKNAEETEDIKKKFQLSSYAIFAPDREFRNK